MNCPNCKNNMKYSTEQRKIFDLSGTADYDYYLVDVYKCKNCNIKKINDEWSVPEKLKPTDKQEKTLLFINSRLKTNFEPITKRQCWEIINNNFEKAKTTMTHYWHKGITDEDCAEMGLDASMFY